ncbi:MAG: LUD domain-containing protein [Spirochaetales bacterium]
MSSTTKFATLATKETVTRTIEALKAQNIGAHFAATAAEAKAKALELIPAGAEVLTNSSITVDAIGLGAELNDTGKYVSLKNKMYAMDRATQGRAIAALVSAPQIAVGSAHAVTEEGSIVIASMSGSNLPSYAFGAEKVVLIISTKKIVKNDEEAQKRLWEHVLPQESARARKAYGLPETFNSNPNTVLTINAQPAPGRIEVIFVGEDFGF